MKSQEEKTALLEKIKRLEVRLYAEVNRVKIAKEHLNEARIELANAEKAYDETWKTWNAARQEIKD